MRPTTLAAKVYRARLRTDPLGHNLSMRVLAALMLFGLVLGCEEAVVKSPVAGIYDGGPTANLELREDMSYVLTWGNDRIEGSWSGESSNTVTLNPTRVNGRTIGSVVSSGVRDIAETGAANANAAAAVQQWSLAKNDDVTSLTVVAPTAGELGVSEPPVFRKF